MFTLKFLEKNSNEKFAELIIADEIDPCMKNGFLITMGSLESTDEGKLKDAKNRLKRVLGIIESIEKYIGGV